ncbi:telomerase protein component 1-like [Pleurodeles waltl]|uniref:telomerase protein component 1-like n=1 Tax=Pleurodeles waltl TaxID=8319 RepID=UPI00370976C1
MGFMTSRPARDAPVSNLARPEKERPKADGKSSCCGQSFTPDVDHMWKMVDAFPPADRSSRHPDTSLPGEWKTVRVFVSSTFDDFYSEREVLVKKVFPELREWCEVRGLSLVECDLRWGVPKDSSSTTIIATCLEELDRCQQDTYGNPLMLVMVGSRVGWVPTAEDVSVEIMEQYQWVPGMSVTGMEIVHGAYRNCNPNALFCFRDPSFIEKLPADMLVRFQDGSTRSQEFLHALKENVCCRFPKEQTLLYQCQVKGTDESSGMQKVQLGSLEHFSSSVLQFLEKRISETFPGYQQVLAQRAGQSHPSWQQMEEAHHKLYLQQKCQLVLGRQQEVDAVLAFLRASTKELQERQESWRDSISGKQGHKQDDRTAALNSECIETQKETYTTESQDPDSNEEQVKDDTRKLLGIMKTPMQDGIGEVPRPASSDVQVEEDTNEQGGSRSSEPNRQKGSEIPQDPLSSNIQKVNGGAEHPAMQRIFPYVVTAHPGMGKSALMAMCITEALKLPNVSVFFHFVGCSPSSVELLNLVQRLCCHLIVDKQAREDVLEKLKEAVSKEILREILREQLKDVQSRSTFPVIFIDAINQLSMPSDATEILDWLSDEDFLPPTCRCIVSTTDLTVVSPFVQRLEPLSAECAQNLATTYLARFNKRLSPGQLQLLMLKRSSQNPLWLTLACEELRVFGVFERVTQLIEGFPDSLEGLLSNIVNRLVKENTLLVKELLCLLYFCVSGVLEKDVQQVMAQRSGSEQLPMMHWAEVRRAVKCLLRFGRNAKGMDTLAFFHSCVTEAVKQSLLMEKEVQQGYLQSLADYFEYRCADKATVVMEVPRLLKEGCFNARLVNFLRKDQRARVLPANVKYRYLKDLRCTRPTGPGFMRQPALICSMCAVRSGAFGQLFLNGKSCVMCGQTVLALGKEAYVCHLHYRFGMTECFICRSHIHLPKSAVPALLCHYCAIFSWCAVIKV